MRAGSSVHEREIVIRPAREAGGLDPGELWRTRHILRALVWRSVRNRFADTYLGVAWLCVRPLLFVLVFVTFKRLSNADPHVEIPYPLYVYSGLILWYYLIESASEAAGAVTVDAALLKKVYYPRIYTPLTPILANLTGLGVALIPLAAMMAWYGVSPGPRLLLLPVVGVQAVSLALGIGALVASLTLGSRDWERALGFLFYLGLFVSPVIYAAEMIPAAFRPVYFFNPFAGTLLAFRSVLFADQPFPVWEWAYAVVFSAVMCAIGLRAFRLAEAELADRL
ncbi:MAG TPA: ABC transporter permease [Candidatus Tectomicrobia bacterium]|nr:ABC transporter permease [Candidatus Tectomicrobia bacterium]